MDHEKEEERASKERSVGGKKGDLIPVYYLQKTLLFFSGKKVEKSLVGKRDRN